MKSAKELIKYLYACVIRFILAVCSLFIPIKKNQILFQCFQGNKYSCNPKTIYEAMLNDSNYEFVWAFIEPSKFLFLCNNKNTKICRYRSLSYYYYLLTSRIIVTNANIKSDMYRRKKQVVIQTWHGGGCYKKIGVGIEKNTPIHTWIVNHKSENNISVFISSSQYFTEEVIRKQYLFNGEILEIGMPRNDILVNYEKNLYLAKKVRNSLNIPQDVTVVLYAPTFRDESDRKYEELDYEKLRLAVEKRFARKCIILYRGHHVSVSNNNHADKDVTEYNDMQELLLMSDILITDYSSSIWDFSFTYKPCFLYTPDLQDYVKYRGFDKEIHEWGFPISESNIELMQRIQDFNADNFEQAMKKHHADLNSYENGNAANRICDYIREI